MASAELGYWAAQEQHDPRELLDLLVRAERAGLRRCLTSDHFHPWFHTKASSGSTLVWMAAALERTSEVWIGTAVTAPVYRYHPAILAQAFATLDHLHPGRVGLGLGTGEAMNEVPLGSDWPPFRTRWKRMEEAIRILRLLWTGDFVTFEGEEWRLRDANLYVRPTRPLPIYVAASGPSSSELAGRLADGLITVPMERAGYHDIVFPSLRKGAEQAGRDPDTLRRLLEFKFSYHPDADAAVDSIRRWGATEAPGIFGKEVCDPRELERIAHRVDEKELLKTWVVVTELEDLLDPLEAYVDLGFQEVYLHSSSPDEGLVMEGLPAFVAYAREAWGEGSARPVGKG